MTSRASYNLEHGHSADVAKKVFESFVLFISGFLAGAMNALAGGGSFLGFPALMLVGLPPINANATCTLALLPGSIASIFAYKNDLDAKPQIILTMSFISFVGGLLGAIIMLKTPPGIFIKVIPVLLLLATLIFAFGNRLTSKLLGKPLETGGEKARLSFPAIVLQLVIATYGGYFGAGMGIVTLAALSLLGMTRLNAMNALKVILTSIANGIAALSFVVAGAIFWKAVMVMSAGSVCGGFIAAKTGRRLPAPLVKRFIVAIGLTITVVYFFKA